MRSLAFGLLCAVAGALALWTFQPTPEPEYRDVIVTRDVIVKGEPDTVVKIVERVKWRTVVREVRAVAPLAATETVVRFVEAATAAADTTRADSVPVMALIRSGTYNGRTLTLWQAQSDGDLARESFNVRAPFRFTMQGDAAFVQGNRWWWVRPLLTHTVAAAGGAAACKIGG